MAMNRIERNSPAWFDTDDRVIELFRSAHRRRNFLWKKMISWGIASLFCVAVWWGLVWLVARAIDMARNY